MAVSGVLAGNSNMEDVARTIGEAGGILFYCLLCVFSLYALALSVVYPAILVMFAREGTFASCFKLREAFELISRNAGPFFTAWGVSIAASLVVSLVAGFAQAVLNLIPCLGQLVSLALTMGIVVYTSAIYAHLFGQFGAIALGQSELVPTS